MSKPGNNDSLIHKFAMAIGYIGVAVAGITLILMIEPSLRQTANGYFIIGVGLIVLSGAILAGRIVINSISDLKKSWSRS